MVLFTFSEIFDMVLMTAAVGFIFSTLFKRPMTHEDHDPLKEHSSWFNWKEFQFAILIAAPGILLHEFGHKFVALGFGMEATFQAAYLFLALGVVLKFLSFPFIFFVPAYVSIVGSGTPLEFSLIAFSGPFVNLALWLGMKVVADKKLIQKKYIPTALLISKINMLLFIFNMLPIPGFDGSKVYMGILEHFFGPISFF